MRYSVSVIYAAAMALGVVAAAPTLGQVINEDLKLLANDRAAGDGFGYSIAIDNGIVAVGAVWYVGFSGSAYLFDSSTGAQIAQLLPNDGATADRFGFSIAIDNGIVAIGARGDDDNGTSSGSAYVFDASTGVQIAKLLPSDGAQGDDFGTSIAIDRGVVAVGAPLDDDNGDRSGSAYVFDASTGAQIAKLLPSDGATFDIFGISIAIDNGLVAVGAHGNDDNGSSSGSAYVFDALTGAQIAKLLPSDGAAEDSFGFSIAIDNGLVAVGAHGNDDNGSGSGSAYVFDASSGAQIAKLLPSDGAAEDRFGNAIAIDNGIVTVGAYLDDDNGEESGSAYVFDVGSNGDCLDLTIENLVAGERAIFALSGGTPGAKAATVYGTKFGKVSIKDYAGFCATFGIAGVKQDKVIGGLNRTFDGNGELTFELAVPANLAGQPVMFQTAQKDTCPDECVSNVVETVVQ